MYDLKEELILDYFIARGIGTKVLRRTRDIGIIKITVEVVLGPSLSLCWVWSTTKVKVRHFHKLQFFVNFDI